MSISALCVEQTHRTLPAHTCPCTHLHVLCMDESTCLLLVSEISKLFPRRGLNHLAIDGLCRAMSDLSYQSIDVAPVLPVTLGGQCSRRSRFSPWRNTNGHADSFWFGHLSSHWSPCGLPLWWQMDCHLWMRGDWDTSPHTSLSGVQSLPLFCSPLHVMLHPSFLALFMDSPSSVVISPFLTDAQKKVWAVTEGLRVKCPQLPAVSLFEMF